LLFIVLILFAGTLAGSYPAFLLSAFRPTEILKNKFKFTGANMFSRALIVFQFAIVILLVISTMIMGRQLDFIKTKKLGYSDEQVVVLPIGRKYAEVFKNEITQRRGILETATGGQFASGLMTYSFNDDEREYWARIHEVDYTFLDLLEIEVVQGRSFQRERLTDAKEAVIVNETFVKEFAIDSPIGTKLPSFHRLKEPTIIGVVKDFHFRSLHYPVEPLVLTCAPSWAVLAKISAFDMPGTIAFLKEKWQIINPDSPFQYTFLDEHMDSLYKSENRWSTIVLSASFFSSLIACLGLLGLALLVVVRRTKEIGIHKVLGATILNISTMLSKDFVKLVLLANIFAWPIAWFAMNRWLQNFAYRIDVGWWVFVQAGGLALVIALLMVSTQAIRAALANPVESLRYE